MENNEYNEGTSNDSMDQEEELKMTFEESIRNFGRRVITENCPDEIAEHDRVWTKAVNYIDDLDAKIWSQNGTENEFKGTEKERSEGKFLYSQMEAVPIQHLKHIISSPFPESVQTYLEEKYGISLSKVSTSDPVSGKQSGKPRRDRIQLGSHFQHARDHWDGDVNGYSFNQLG